jgi:hypothetical protein
VFRKTHEIEGTKSMLLHSGQTECYLIPRSLSADYDIFEYAHRIKKPNVISYARSYRTLRDASFEDAFPGTSCQATVGVSLLDGLAEGGE